MTGMNIKLRYDEKTAEYMGKTDDMFEMFRIPIDSEADEYISGAMRIQRYGKNNNKFLVTTDCGAVDNIEHATDIMHVAIKLIYYVLAGCDITDPR